MIYFLLFFLGLCFGSFVNAAVWRVHEQSLKGRTRKEKDELSITRGRSMCTHCKHTLSALDLIPVLSWLYLAGKCRYCKHPISIQYPLIELLAAMAFVTSYYLWPVVVVDAQIFYFIVWLLMLVGFIFLIIYDYRWFLLPDKIVFPLVALGVIQVVVRLTQSPEPFMELLQHIGAIAVTSGLFWVLFQLSNGQWIGGGDVKLGIVLGLVIGNPLHAMVMLFLASVFGLAYALPGLLSKHLRVASRVPFGPFLILATIVVFFFGGDLVVWYQQQFLFM